MQWPELLETLKNNFGRYVIWLLANLGGLLIAYLAAVIVSALYNEFQNLMPGKDVYLITGAILLTATMASYQKTKAGITSNLWIGLYIIWPFLLMLVFGFLLAIGIKQPNIEPYQLWIYVIVIFVLAIIWSSIVWLHEQGIYDDMMKTPDKPPTDPNLVGATVDLPKLVEDE